MNLGIAGIGDAVRIGEGGYGIVYRARQEALGRDVAVKVLRAHGADEHARQRFERESQALGRLSGHPHVGAVYACGLTSAGQLYLVMEHLSGGSLADRLRHEGPLPWPEVCDIGIKLADALAATHAEGVLHRDLKPENVLVSGYGQPQLVDFGVARVHGSTATRSGVVTGTLAHAAPEVVSGASADERSDVYSLGSTLYALLAGEAPFVRPGEETLHALVARILTEDPPDLRPRGVPSALWGVLSGALAKDPAARTPTAAALGEALLTAREASHAAGAPAPPLLHTRTIDFAGLDTRSVPRPSTTGDERPGRRRRIIGAGVAVAVLAVVAGVVALTRDSGGPSAAATVAADGDDDASPATTTSVDAGTAVAGGASAPVTPGPEEGTAAAPPGLGQGETRPGTVPEEAPPETGAVDDQSPGTPLAPPAEPPPASPPGTTAPPPAPAPTPGAPLAPPLPPTSDDVPCEATQTTQAGHAVQYCPLWQNEVPVYDSPDLGNSATQVGTLVIGGTVNWFVGQSNRSEHVFSFNGFEYRNTWWAFTMADNGVWGWVPENYFAGGADYERDAGLHVCGTMGNICAP